LSISDDGYTKARCASNLEDSLQVIIEAGLCKAPAGKICQLDAEGDDAVGLEFMKRIAQLSIAEGAIQLLSRDDQANGLVRRIPSYAS
jgi:hypothetical protein